MLLIRSETLKLCRDISTENSEMSTTPCSVYDTVQPAFAVNNLSVLKECWADLLREIDAISESSIEQLLCAMSSTDHSLSRNISAEIYIPKSVRDQKNKSCTAMR